MLPIKVVETFGRIVQIGNVCGFIPYSWNKNKQKIEFQTSRKVWLRLRFLIQFSFILLYEIFLVIRCFQLSTLKEFEAIPVIKKIRLIYMTSWFLSLNVNQIVILENFGMHRTLLDNFMAVTTEFNEDYGNGQKMPGNGRNLVRVVKTCFFGCLFACITNSLAAIISPSTPMLLTSVFNDPKSLPLTLKLTIGLAHLYFNWYHYYLLVFNYSTIIIYVTGILHMLPQMRRHEQREGETLQVKIRPVEFQRSYRILSVLQSHFNSMFSLWTLICEIIGMFVVIVNIFQSAIYSNARALILAFVVCLAVLYIYDNLGHVHEVSQRMLATWKGVGFPRWFRKAHRAASPLHVKIGSFFADRALVLTIMSIIIVNSTNLILTFRYD